MWSANFGRNWTPSRCWKDLPRHLPGGRRASRSTRAAAPPSSKGVGSGLRGPPPRCAWSLVVLSGGTRQRTRWPCRAKPLAEPPNHPRRLATRSNELASDHRETPAAHQISVCSVRNFMASADTRRPAKSGGICHQRRSACKSGGRIHCAGPQPISVSRAPPRSPTRPRAPRVAP